MKLKEILHNIFFPKCLDEKSKLVEENKKLLLYYDNTIQFLLKLPEDQLPDNLKKFISKIKKQINIKKTISRLFNPNLN